MPYKIRCAVIGVGNMGKNRARIYAELPDAELVAIVDTNESTGSQIAGGHGARYYKDFLEMIGKENPGAVSICVPTSLHYKVSKLCIEKGMNVLIEKPITTNIQEAAELLLMANEKGVSLAVGHIERHNPAVKAAKKIVDSGELGKITNIIARRVGPFPPQIQDVDIAVDMAVHDIDIINYILGAKPDTIITNKQKNKDNPHEDSVDFLLRYGPISAYIQTNWITPVKIRKLNITGTEGYIELDYIKQEIKFYKSTYERIRTNPQNFSDFILTFAQPLKKEVIVEKKEPLKEEIIEFLKNINEGARPNSQYAIDALEIALRQ